MSVRVNDPQSNPRRVRLRKIKRSLETRAAWENLTVAQRWEVVRLVLREVVRNL
jgi:hypothetical protein